MTKLLSWLIVVGVCSVSAYYLNWIAYGPAASLDGTIKAVLRLGLKWYGLPAACVVQLSIWLMMPRLFSLAPTVWIAAMIWPFISALCKVAILWNIKPPAPSDWVTIGGLMLTIIVSWIVKMRTT